MRNENKRMAKKVFVNGCYDLLHSGHVEFFQQASQYGDGSGDARPTGFLLREQSGAS